MSEKKKTEEELQQSATDYAAMREELLQGLLNAQPFAFDLNADALYQQYKNSYRRMGTDAAQDAFGRAATLTGGYGNSYALSVASQVYNDYMLALQDKGLQLYESAYDRYKDEWDRKADLFKKTDALEQETYDREQEAYDREKAEQKELYEREQAEEKERYDREQDVQKQIYDREQDVLAFAYKMAQLGDYSYLKEIGIDVSQLEETAKQEENAPEKISVTIQNTAQETYYTYGYRALVNYLDLQIAYGQITEKGKTQVLKALTGRTS